MTCCHGLFATFREFSGWTSAHGIPHIGQAKNWFIRFFWTITFFLMLGAFGWQFSMMVTDRLSYLTDVATEISFGEQVFPVVTICNKNPYKLTELDGNAPEVKKLMNAFLEAVTKDEMDPAMDSGYGFIGLNSTLEKLDRVWRIMTLLAKHLPADKLEKISYTREELMRDCSFAGQPCNASDFVTIVDPTYGACFQFNTESTYRVGRDGPEAGLKLTLLPAQYSPPRLGAADADPSEMLPVVPTASMLVSVHEADAEPFPDSFGWTAGVSTATYIATKLTKYQRLKKPWGECIDGMSEEDYFYSTKHSMEGCFRSCYQKHVIEHCNCSDPRYARPDGVGWCGLKDVDCLMTLKENEHVEGSDQQINVLRDCGCFPPCQETTYRTTISQSFSPALNYKIPHWCTQRDILVENKWTSDSSCKSPELCLANVEECITWYRENSVLVYVFYQELLFHRYVEQEKFTNFDLVLGLGGQLGLWLGISVITMIEFVGLGILLLMLVCTRGKTEQVQEAPEDREAKDLKRIQSLLKDRQQRKAKKKEQNYDDEEDEEEEEEKKKEEDFDVEDPYPDLKADDLYGDDDNIFDDPYPEIAS